MSSGPFPPTNRRNIPINAHKPHKLDRWETPETEITEEDEKGWRGTGGRWRI